MQQVELFVMMLQKKMRPTPAALRMKLGAANKLAIILGLSLNAVLDASANKDLNWFKQRAEYRAVSTKRLGEK